MVWYNPFSWFSRNANAIARKASTNVLKSALRNYIKAVNSLKPNMRTNQAITKLLNKANVNATNKRIIRNRLANGVAKIVFASRPAIAQAANVVANGAPEGPAAVAVNNATRKINNFRVSPPIPAPVGIAGKVFGVTKGKNQNNNASRTNINYITKIAKNATYATNTNRVKTVLAYNPTVNFAALVNKTNNANVKRLLKLLTNVPAAARPAAAAAAVNAVSNTGEALSSMFANRTALNAVLAKTVSQKLQSNINNRNKSAALVKELKNTADEAGVNLTNKNVNAALTRIMSHESRLPVAAVNNRFKNMNINALVNSAAQSMAMSNENKAKLKAAMNAKINTLNENSMNRVRLVNATRNLN